MRYILVECNPDKLLARKLGIPKKSIIHAGSKSEVCKRLEKRMTNSVGLIDEDPFSVQPRYIKKLEILENSQKFGIRVLSFCCLQDPMRKRGDTQGEVGGKGLNNLRN